MNITACAKTDIGLSRQTNEDVFLADLNQGLFIVADGMGGHVAGEVASRTAVETVQRCLREAATENPGEVLEQAVHLANEAVQQAARENPSLHGMGTTLSILSLHSGRFYLAHVGDSRVYLLRNTVFQQLSNDHSLIGEQLRRGILTAEEAKHSSLGNILLQAIGLSPELDICRKTLTPHSGDRLLICSDGLTHMLSDESIREILQQSIPVSALCEALIAKAISAGGTDNVTVIVIQIEE